jgi:anti-sigma-K factor RskA
MTDTPLPPMEEDEALAAEYVLGVNDLAERMATEARIKAEPAFAALVAKWETRLAPMNDDFPETPAPNLLPQIEARLFPKAPRMKIHWFGWLSLALSTALAGWLIFALIFLTPDPNGALVATLTTDDGSLVYEARHKEQSDALVVTRLSGSPAAAGQVHQLWIIAPDAAPVSLGLLADGPLSVLYPVPPAGWTLAVSIEPAGGSPTGAPTGPVILSTEIGA